MKYSLRSLMIAVTLAGPLSLLSWNGLQVWKRSQRPTCQPSLRQLTIAIRNYHNMTKCSP